MTGSEQTPPSSPGADVGCSLKSVGCGQADWSSQTQTLRSPTALIPDQGYLAMGASVNISQDLPEQEAGLEPMSNSLLNGLLDKQLDEVYMLLLNDNLARCNSNMDNSLLHGLVPPPQPICQLQGADSLDPSLNEPLGEDSVNKVSCSRDLAPFSSDFKTPVLRISELESTNLK